MASSIKQRISEAKKELKNHLSSEGVDIEPHRDDIEKMKDVLETDKFDVQPAELDFNHESSNEIKEEIQNLEEELSVEESEFDQDEIEEEKKEFQSEEQSNVESNLNELEEQLRTLESEENTEDISFENEDVKDDKEQSNNESADSENVIDSSYIASAGLNSELDLEPGKIEQPRGKDFEESKNSSESHTYREKDESLEQRLERIESDVREHEEQMVSEESEELSKVNDLENRIEKLELNDDSDLESRIQEMESKVERLESLENLDKRLSEMEDQLIKEGSISSRIKEVLEKQVGAPASEEELEDIEQHVNKSLEEYHKKTERLWEMIEEVDSDSGSVSDEQLEELDTKVDNLWEAMDEELASLESRIHKDEQDMEDLTSMVVELSELVKEKLRDH